MVSLSMEQKPAVDYDADFDGPQPVEAKDFFGLNREKFEKNSLKFCDLLIKHSKQMKERPQEPQVTKKSQKVREITESLTRSHVFLCYITTQIT